jgi:hypothetical protein
MVSFENIDVFANHKPVEDLNDLNEPDFDEGRFVADKGKVILLRGPNGNSIEVFHEDMFALSIQCIYIEQHSFKKIRSAHDNFSMGRVRIVARCPEDFNKKVYPEKKSPRSMIFTFKMDRSIFKAFCLALSSHSYCYEMYCFASPHCCYSVDAALL